MTFEGVFNFRDLGRHHTVDGRVLRSGRLFRADDLTRLTDSDYERFRALGIRTVIDLRRPVEIEHGGRIRDLPGVTYHNVHLRHPKWVQPFFADTDHRVEFLLARYAEMTSEGGPAIGETLVRIADADQAPLVFHCAAGKDRTGLVAAIALHLLGVSDEDIAVDYHLSEQAESQTWRRYISEKGMVDAPDRSHIVVSPPKAILETFAALRARHGSLTAYAESIGVSATHIAAMRAHLVA